MTTEQLDADFFLIRWAVLSAPKNRAIEAERAVARIEEQLERRELRCQKCGGENPVWWVEDDIWNAVMGTLDNPRGEGVIVCPSCFYRGLFEQHDALRRAIEDMGDHVVALERIGKRALGIDA